ncbi:MAG: tryptophan 7-halogenase [Gammaproteobacteria bacterium]
MSVGAVCWPEYLKTRGDKSLEQFLWDTVALCPDAARRMANAKLSGQVWATGNYSYRSTRFYGERYVLIGDAYAFIDPVFSTGVFLAMRGAELGAEAVDAWLRDPQAAAPRFRRIEAQLERAMDFVSWFIYRFTSPAMHHLFMNPRDRLGIPQAIVSMLAGDLFNTDPRIMRPITIFKGIYYLTALGQVSKSWMAYRLRKRNIAAPFNDGTTPQDAI